MNWSRGATGSAAACIAALAVRLLAEEIPRLSGRAVGATIA